VFISRGKIGNTKKFFANKLKLTYALSFSSPHSTITVGHFEDLKVNTISIKCNESSFIKCKTAHQTNKLPGTVYSISESLALGYSYTEHYTMTIMGQQKGWGINTNHTNFLI